MKKALLLFTVSALMFVSLAISENSFDGSVYDAYMPIYNEELLAGWEVISYIEPSGLLLSATTASSEISLTVEESGDSPVSLLTARLAGVSRYGTEIEHESIIPFDLSAFETAARIKYSYRSLRDSGEGYRYRVTMYAAKLKTGYIVTVSQTSWDETDANYSVIDEFVNSLRLEQKKISTIYTAFLTYCERKSDGIYVTLDYCEMEFEQTFLLPYAVNEDEVGFTYRLSPQALIWLPNFGDALYSLRKAQPDETEISIAIENYYNLNLTHAVYLVLFDDNNQVIRLQHYNAL